MADIAIGHNESIKNKIFKAVKSRNSTKTPVKRLSNRLGRKQPKKITWTKENFIRDARNSQERGLSLH